MQDICAFFGVARSDQLVWAHRVNTPALLEQTLFDPRVMMVEGDVLLDDARELVMASPFKIDGVMVAGSLSFGEWFSKMSGHQKGVKIDIQHPDALHPVLQMVADMDVTTPVIIHADIFNLLENSDATFEPEMFVQQAQRILPGATLSIGWSLSHAQDANGKMEAVLIEQITDLLLTKLGGVSYTIEFRAGYTPNWEKGAALIFEPIDNVERPAFGENVVDGIALFRKDLFVSA